MGRGEGRGRGTGRRKGRGRGRGGMKGGRANSSWNGPHSGKGTESNKRGENSGHKEEEPSDGLRSCTHTQDSHTAEGKS